MRLFMEQGHDEDWQDNLARDLNALQRGCRRVPRELLPVIDRLVTHVAEFEDLREIVTPKKGT